MKKYEPALTLLGVALFMVGLFVVNETWANPVESVRVAASPTAASTAATPSSEPTSAATPTQTATVSASPSKASSGFPPEAAYTGWTAAHEASIAIAVKADRAVAYLCDGTQLESWLRGTARDGVLTLRSKSAEVLTARRSGNTVAGEVTVQGKRLAFSTQLTTPPGGLYTATVATAQATVTWIVRSDGGQTGLRVRAGQASSAPRLDPGTGVATVDGITVQAKTVDGEFEPGS